MMKRTLAPALILFLATSGFARSGEEATWVWEEQAKLRLAHSDVNDELGSSVALDGDTALVGAPWTDEACPGNPDCNSGSAYVFVRAGTVWALQAQLLANDAGQMDQLGKYSVAVCGDLAAAASYQEDSTYVFARSGTTWNQEAKLSGLSAALDGEGLAIGDYGGYGAVYVHERAGGSWPRLAELHPSDGIWTSHFGRSVSLDGDWLLVGAPQDDDLGYHSGSVYVFRRSGSSWVEQAKLKANDGDSSDSFGYSVSLSGTTALIGAYEDEASGARSGSAYVFERSGTSWNQQAKLVPSDGGPQDLFAGRVSVSGDRALIGTLHGEEHAYLFVRSGWTWREETFLETLDSTIGFGADVALDGDNALVGSPGDHEGRGSAYVFTPLLHAGTGYCFGDPGSGTPCPCNNDNDGSVPGSGCDNGVFASGAHLMAYGNASVSDDSLVLRATSVEPFNSGLFFQANNRTNGGAGSVFGDGLRCAGGGLVRLQVTFAGSHASVQTTIAIGAKGGVTAGDTKRYQYWYRTTTAPPCGTLVNEFNLSNGYEVLWLP